MRNEFGEVNENKSQYDMSVLKRKRLLDSKFSSALKEIAIYTVFLVFLLSFTYSNTSFSSFQYNKIFLMTFIQSLSANDMGLNEVMRIKNTF